MPLRPPAGFISAFYDPLKVANAPTIGTATGGDTSASVAFTAPTNTGGAAITQYYAVSNPGRITGNAASSPVTVSGLTNGTSYTFTVWALNSYGPSPYSAASGSVTPALPQRGLIAGGFTPNTNVIEYIEIQTLGNSTDFGDLTVTVTEASAMSNVTRAVFAGGGSSNNVMGYVTIASASNATDFGDLTGSRAQMSQGSINSTTRGIVAGGWTGSTVTAQIQYITIGTTGNATDFGNLSRANGYWPAGCSSSTRGIIAGGSDSSGNYFGYIDYITIASAGNSSTFGTLSPTVDGVSGCSNATRGVFAQGYDSVSLLNSIEYITIASTGNSTDFGDCSTSSRGSSSMSSSTRAVINVGASGYPYASNIMEYITIATTGNAADFGDLTISRGSRTACSASNGGTQ